jgi:hypothetical protein
MKIGTNITVLEPYMVPVSKQGCFFNSYIGSLLAGQDSTARYPAKSKRLPTLLVPQ